MPLLETLLALGAIVALHEFGHLLVARFCRMRVDRYSIGFGPVLLSFRAGETEYALSMLPFGGYVKIAGMNPQDGTAPDDVRSYANRPAWQRFLVLAAGPFTNYLLAFLLLANLNFFGMPKPMSTPTIGDVVVGSPAAQAGLRADDTFITIGGATIANFSDVTKQVQASKGQPTEVRFKRGTQELTTTVTPHPVGNGWRIEARPKTEIQHLSIGRSILAAASDTAAYNFAIVLGLVDMVHGRGNMEVGGTLAAVAETMQAAELGIAIFFLQVAGLSVAVALFNLLPVPALDGGRIFFVLLEMIRRKPVNPRVETAVHAMGFLFLLGVIVVVTIGDVRKRLPQMGYFGGVSMVDAGVPPSH